jgi:hypothetical protein
MDTRRCHASSCDGIRPMYVFVPLGKTAMTRKRRA